MPDKPAENSLTRSLRRYRPDYILLWVIALASLALNLIVINQLLALRRASGQAIADAIAVISQIENQTFTTQIAVNDQIAIDTTFPVNETIPIDIKQTLPINTTVTVPVNGGLFGPLNLTVPIKADVPVEIKQDIKINQPFKIKTSVPVHLDVPVSIRVADTELAVALADMKKRLLALAETLGSVTATPTPEVAP